MAHFNKICHFSGIFFLILIVGCATGESGLKGDTEEDSTTNVVSVDNPSVSLADYLRRIPGVIVNGNGPSAAISVRGTESMMNNQPPLFVMDGVKIGRDFSRVSSLVNLSEVKKIRVVKGVEASAAYGMDGASGVVEIYSEET
ncbi:Plug domain-containing protein [Aliifodinibius sp. S!AR15-10]|uniref:TonB-dependent receptor n=1 Tax=Aliifodinibius sp. S!AR15-10 TaxID=2950437 RepID=UPI0028567499|nr:TonB-dependent receptor plug domain-containing protein [Aliifodinibius sp. S!AR15-10]MDR8393987.1 Plug domain-containing protein [Aliifodinibius sp. S!AR15-10]